MEEGVGVNILSGRQTQIDDTPQRQQQCRLSLILTNVLHHPLPFTLSYLSSVCPPFPVAQFQHILHAARTQMTPNSVD